MRSFINMALETSPDICQQSLYPSSLSQRGKNLTGRAVPLLSLVIAEAVAQEVPRVTQCCNELGQPGPNGFMRPSMHPLALG